MIDARARRERRTRSAVIRELMAVSVAEEEAEEQALTARQEQALLSLASVGRDLSPELEASREADRRRPGALDATSVLTSSSGATAPVRRTRPGS